MQMLKKFLRILKNKNFQSQFFRIILYDFLQLDGKIIDIFKILRKKEAEN